MNTKTPLLTSALITILASSIWADANGRAFQVILLPIEQQAIAEVERLSRSIIQDRLQARLTWLPDARFNMVPYESVLERLNGALVDRAVFELLVTETLETTLEEANPHLSRPADLAKELKKTPDPKPDYLITIRVHETSPQRKQRQVALGITQVSTGDVVYAYSFQTYSSEPSKLVGRIVKHFARGLWQIVHPLHSTHPREGT